MKGNKNSLGYTIIEVMVVLAVSGVMFAIAAGFINGKQANTSFTQGVNDFAIKLQTTIQDVTDGHYTDIGSFTCSKSASPELPQFTSVAAVQGTNNECTFAGKFIHTPISNNTKTYEIFSLAALRQDTSYKTVVPIYKPGVIDLTVQGTVPQNLDITSIKRDGGSQVYGFGFLQSQGTPNGPGDGYVSGSQLLKLAIAPSLSSAGLNIGGAVTALKSNGTTSAYDTSITSVTVCLSDGTRTATVNVGSTNGNKLDVDVKVEPC